MASRLLPHALLAIALAAASCTKPPASEPAAPKPAASKPRGPATFPVEVAPALEQRVEYQLSAVGGLEAFEEVQVVARVEGAVERVQFQEGDRIRAGASLAEIEPERFRLAAAAAQAALDRALAKEAEARAAVARREAADAQDVGLYAAEEVDSWKTRLATASAAVSQAKVAVEQAQLDLEESRVRAPVGGVIQTRTVQTGQYVNEGDVLATLVQRDPLQLRFEVPEPDAARLSRGMAVSFRVRGVDRDFSAQVTHVAAQASETTRMVRVTSRVADTDDPALRPGAFAEVTVPIGASDAAVVIPDTAVRPSERGFLAFVVDGDRASERVVELGLRTKEGGVEIRSGVKAGEIVVIRGGEALRDGATVKVAGAAPASATPAATGATP